MSTLLQIVPRIPGGLDGVGDYALTIARKFSEEFQYNTVFAAFNIGSTQNAGGFRVVELDSLPDQSAGEYDHILLHYVNYGFQKRGVPFRLLSILRKLRERTHEKLVTIFHELYASGPPWSSAFWLQPLQKNLAKSVADLSGLCIVSSDNSRRALRRMAPHAEIELHPVPSGLGEPALSADQIANRDSHRWAIFGGTGLAERSLRSFRQIMPRIPDSIAPHSLSVLGGADNPATRSMLVDLGIDSNYRPCVSIFDASDILKTCSFAWLDYFHRPDVEMSVILKSSAFAAVCAHAVIPIFPHRGAPVSIEGDPLPGPFFISRGEKHAPPADNRAPIAQTIYDWYQRHVSSQVLVSGVAEVLGLSGKR